LVVALLAAGIAACGPAQSPAPEGSTASPSSAAPVTPPPLQTTVILGDGRPSTLPEVQERQERIAAALQAPPFILRRDGLDARIEAAQEAVVADPRVQRQIIAPSGEPYRAEVMTVAEARPGDIPPALAGRCGPGTCVRVVVFVYPTNTTVTAIVDDRAQVLDVQALADAQPEIPEDLAALATKIAISDPQVAAAFDGLTPDAAMAAMSATKTALDNTSCERSRHLCVAPVFTWGTSALWTIVDLTDFKIVAATTWTDQGQSGRRRVYSEATLQDAAVAPLCDTPQRIERDGWTASYLLTSSDGLELRDVSFQDRLLLRSVKVVDWHVGYTGRDDQRVGFSDAIGCPVFSSAAVIPYGLPSIEATSEGGFQLVMTFRSPNWPNPCNYQYSLSATFAQDGALTVLAGNEGRGCGVSGVYHPVLRLEPAEGSQLSSWDGSARTTLMTEGRAEWPAGGPQRIEVASEDGAGLAISPVWGDAGLAYVYWSQAKDAEGRGDLPSIGQCCALDFRQGPETFADPPEPLGSTPVLWYVPRIENAERERCWADSAIENGEIVVQVWPCSSGVVVK